MTSTRHRVLLAAATAAVLVFFLLPIVYLASVSFKTPDDVLTGSFLPHAATLANWPKAFAATALSIFIQNSVVVSVLSSLLTLAITTPAVYATARLGVQAKWLPDAVLSSYIAPPVVALLPFFFLLKATGLINTTAGLTLIYGLMNIPVAFWLLQPFVRQVPLEIEEAASLDGAGPVRKFLFIVVPLIGPGLAATVLITMILAYDEFLLASVLSFADANRTLPVGISLFQGDRLVNFGQMAAASLAGIVPIYGLSLLGQRWLVEGLSHGAMR